MTKENPLQSISITSLLSFNKMGRHTGSTTKPWSSTCAVPLNCGLFVLVSILISWKFGDRFKKRLFFLIWVTPTMKSSPSRLCRCKEWGVILFPLPQGSFPFDCLSLLLAWYYYWHGVLPFIIHFFMPQYSLFLLLESASQTEFILVPLFMQDWFEGGWSRPPPHAQSWLAGRMRLLIHTW